jgi:Uncharacterized conserved protein
LSGDPQALIARLGLKPHPEGGHYAETFRDGGEGLARGACTAIYYLLQRGERSHWHKVDAAEVWAFHAGDPLKLRIAGAGGIREIVLGADVPAGQQPQAVVPAFAWQAAESLGAWSLVGCIVAPAFDFAGFTMAPPGWEPTEDAQ